MSLSRDPQFYWYKTHVIGLSPAWPAASTRLCCSSPALPSTAAFGLPASHFSRLLPERPPAHSGWSPGMILQSTCHLSPCLAACLLLFCFILQSASPSWSPRGPTSYKSVSPVVTVVFFVLMENVTRNSKFTQELKSV